ncbi:transcription factor A, mitochondrial [Ictalurus punctatus]|uniref:Transcription factor A, mitochondrial n=1 Tax=Ictalurus punctatus TaxID=7998 RepID=W5URE2_ICTPU|nr:transcription factor A, mitochondrial [Ictalurus punctatus]
MAPFNLMTVGANLLARSWSLFSSAVTVRCACVAPTVKNFSTTAGGPPKRPLTAYLRYVKEQQPVVVRQNPDIKVVDIVRKIAQQWRTLTPEEKQPFEEASLAAREQYKVDKKAYQDQLTPAQSAAIAEEKRQKAAKRRAIRKKRELNSLGKPKRPRTGFNIFMAEHFEEAKGSTMPGKMKSLFDDWNRLSLSQKQIYMQLAEDDKVRYKNEMKAWEEHMTELGREDLVRRKESKRKKAAAAAKGGKKKSRVKVLKAKAPAKKTAGKKAAAAAETKSTTSSTKK